MIAIAPSILAADFARLGEQVLETERGGANRIHVDVMDGHFVPNLSMGPAIAHSLRQVTKLPLEVHLMVDSPANFAEPFRLAGVNSLIVHHEVLPDPLPLLAEIRAHGCKVGIAINPATPVEVLEPFLPILDVALCMTVWPGFGGQAFLPESLDRIRGLRKLIDRINPHCELEVDGGIDSATAEPSVAAGANVLVVGTAVFGAGQGPQRAVEEFRSRFAGRGI
jgi:ribulose-phosphate 3-epimerase